ncbi:MAG: FAD-dependent tricarballylate dehydrogenase TcuA [Burkholderiales bacterium]|nr:FAD-dependent tricarballylate dehydrogenase TcuA [Burkholderiales bacterium]
MEQFDTLDFDVVVVGCGIAGLSAAVSAMQAGAKVAILERSDKSDRGGQTRWTEAMLRMKSEHEVADDFERHFAENAGHYLDPELVSEAARDYENWSSIVKVLNFTDPGLISTITEQAGPTIQWLKTFGVRFAFQPGYFITTCTTRLSPVGGGLALVEALAAAAENGGAQFYYRTTARNLVRAADGKVTGLEAVGPNSRGISFRSRAVILASGGFEGNPEMLTTYLGRRARYIRPVARGGYYNKGEGIRMALAAGAAPAGDYGQIHAEPLDPRSGATEPIVLVFNYGILVNRNGERFIDEAPATVDATYEGITRNILEQPDGIAWAVFDSQIDDVPNWRRAVRSDQPPVSAGTIAELAHKIGVSAQALTGTLEKFNSACTEGRFDPIATDGLASARGYLPPKSNWCRRIERAPFFAYPIICGVCFTFGGIRVNSRSQVINADGDAIPGLYAAGEMTGLYYGTYTGATSVLRGAVFGRIAGRDASELR